jgi:GDP-L-fucose synthase
MTNDWPDSREFWKDKRAWITGGTGFLGQVIARKLKERDCPHVFATGRRDGDLTDLKAVQHLLATFQPTLVIHLAAIVGGIGANRERPAEFFYENLMMGAQVMHESWRTGVQKFVAIGTICAYPKFAPIPFKEEDLWDGYPEETNAPYGLAKKMLLVQAQAYRQQYNWNAIYLLPVNLYGPGDNFDPASSHVIPALIKKFFDAQQSGADHIVAWGDGSPTREFLYVDDAAEGILLASERYNKPAPVNLGSGMEISIKDLTETIARHVGFQGEIRWDTSQPNGQPRRKLDVSRAEREFGFRAQMDFEEGLRRTVRWYEEHVRSLPQPSPHRGEGARSPRPGRETPWRGQVSRG